jgi:hypothetical protein
MKNNYIEKKNTQSQLQPQCVAIYFQAQVFFVIKPFNISKLFPSGWSVNLFRGSFTLTASSIP